MLVFHFELLVVIVIEMSARSIGGNRNFFSGFMPELWRGSWVILFNTRAGGTVYCWRLVPQLQQVRNESDCVDGGVCAGGP
jgi:hypothetical protein